MSMESGVELLWFMGAFALIISALAVRQLKMSEWLKMGLAWAAIFALVFLVIRTYQMVAG